MSAVLQESQITLLAEVLIEDKITFQTSFPQVWMEENSQSLSLKPP